MQDPMLLKSLFESFRTYPVVWFFEIQIACVIVAMLISLFGMLMFRRSLKAQKDRIDMILSQMREEYEKSLYESDYSKRRRKYGNKY